MNDAQVVAIVAAIFQSSSEIKDYDGSVMTDKNAVGEAIGLLREAYRQTESTTKAPRCEALPTSIAQSATPT